MASPLAGIRRTVRQLESPDFMRQMGLEAGRVIQRQVHKGFDEQRDPYGRPWAARKGKGSWPILHKSGKLERSISVRQGSGGVSISAASPYGIYHMTGTKYMVPRPFLPTSAQLPPLWEKELRRAADQQFQRVWGR